MRLGALPDSLEILQESASSSSAELMGEANSPPLITASCKQFRLRYEQGLSNLRQSALQFDVTNATLDDRRKLVD